MLKNYFIIAFRHLIKFKFYSFINILGLSIGIACFLFIVLYYHSEITYDAFHKDIDNIYRIYSVSKSSNIEKKYATNPYALANIISTNHSDAINLTKITFKDLWVGEKFSQTKERVFFADSLFFEVFSFGIQGEVNKHSLKNKKSAIITREYANKLFGKENPIGKIIIIGSNSEFMVNDVVESIPHNSSIKFKIIIPISNLSDFTYKGIEDSWSDWGCHIFIKFQNGYDPSLIETEFQSIITDNAPQYLQDGKMSIGLQKLRNVHLNSFALELEPGQTKSYLYTLLLIGVFVLIISIINFINLTIARSSERYKEIIVRKLLGAESFQLSIQLLFENIILCILASIIACIAVLLLFPDFSNLIGRTIEFKFLTPGFLVSLLGLSVMIGIISGLYPTIIMLKRKNLESIHNYGSVKINKSFRHALVIFQFGISIILIISQFTISSQISYMEDSDYGFDRDNKVFVPLQVDSKEDIKDRIEILLNKLKENSNINSASISQNVPGKHFQNRWEVVSQSNQEEITAKMYVSYIDDEFVNTYGISVISGRSFSKERATDSYVTVLMNEKAIEVLGLNSENALGHIIKFKHSPTPLKIIGVLKNFNFQSKNVEIEPLALLFDLKRYYPTYLTVDFISTDVAKNIEILRGILKENIQEISFEIFSIIDSYKLKQVNENRTLLLIQIITVIAFFLGCMGLFSLSAYLANRRTKEIGIRKVIGASVANIVILLSREFVLLAIIANIIAWPIAYYILDIWLNNYPYRINISFFFFLLSGAIAVTITVISVSIHAVKAALQVPVNTLNQE